MKTGNGWHVAAFASTTLLLSTESSAHHAIGGATPSSAWEGLLSGLAHPVLGVDHLAFLVAVGLVAAFHRRGELVSFAFVAASLVGILVHVLGLDLPSAQWMISLSVVLVGALLVAPPRALPSVIALISTAGIFHGYGYGESIVGAEMTPLSTYLLGLAIIQLVVALAVQHLLGTAALRSTQSARWAGLVIGGVGLAYLGMQWLG
jgi:urease accessory protein